MFLLGFGRFLLGFLDIARTEAHSFTRHLVGMLRMSLPQLPKQLRDQNNSQKPQKQKINFFEIQFCSCSEL